MAVTPGLPKIGEQRFQDYVAQSDMDILLFHDGNQSGHVSKPLQAVDTTNDSIEVNDNIGDTTGDYGFLVNNQSFNITGSTANDDLYTVKSHSYNYDTERTEIVVNETISDSTVDGNAAFGDTNQSGRGDNLRDGDRLVDITTEPTDGGYTRATGQAFETFDDGDDWFIRTSSDTTFDLLTDTTGRVDAVAVIDKWQATNDGSNNDHLLFTAFLDQMYLLDQTDEHRVQANTIRLALR